METNQRLIGQGVALSIPVRSQRQRLDDESGVVGNKAAVRQRQGRGYCHHLGIPVEIAGLSLASTSGNAIDLTSTAALTGSGRSPSGTNEFRGAAAEGIDVNLNAGTTGTLMLNITCNS